MPFAIIWTDRAKKDLKKLEKPLAKRIFEKISSFNEKDLLLLEKVKDQEFFKYRVGSYRVFIEKGPQGTIFVLTVKHRKNAYKR